MVCRKNFIDLNNDERNVLAGAFNDLFARGLIDTYADEHEHHFNAGIHWGPAFLPGTGILGAGGGGDAPFDFRAVIPYWDWTRGDSRDLDAEPWKSFFGGRNNSGGRSTIGPSRGDPRPGWELYCLVSTASLTKCDGRLSGVPGHGVRQPFPRP